MKYEDVPHSGAVRAYRDNHYKTNKYDHIDMHSCTYVFTYIYPCIHVQHTDIHKDIVKYNIAKWFHLVQILGPFQYSIRRLIPKTSSEIWKPQDRSSQLSYRSSILSYKFGLLLHSSPVKFSSNLIIPNTISLDLLSSLPLYFQWLFLGHHWSLSHETPTIKDMWHQ